MRSSAFWVCLVLGTLLAHEARADAPIPACRGRNPAAAARSHAEGLKHYRASKREGRDDAEMTAALGFFDAACAAGDESALELRAYALAGVERFVEAAQTLDVYLASHPLETLPPETQARIAAQRPLILARVASLTVLTDRPGAKVSIDHQAAGVTPLREVRLPPGRHDVEVAGGGLGTIARVLDLGAGAHTEKFAPDEPGPAAAPAPAPGVVASDAPATTTGGYRTLVIGTATGGGVFLLGGIAGAIWASERLSYYNSNDCATMNKAGCSSTLDQSHIARGIEITGFVGAGLGAAAAGTLLYLDYRHKHETAASVACLPTLMGLSCAGRF
jgi:hypothetical protein